MGQSISIAFNICAFGIIVPLLILSAFSVSLKKRINLWFFLNILCFFLSFLCDLCVELMIGHPGLVFHILIRVFNCLSYCSSGLQIIFFAWYLYEYLSIKKSITIKPFIIMSALGGGVILLSVIAFFTHLYVRLDEKNNYIQQSTFWMSEIGFAMTSILCVWIVLHYARFQQWHKWLSLIMYGIIPILCYALEVMIPDLFIAQFGASITILIIYVNIQVDLLHEMQVKEAELTENRIAMMFSQIQPHFLYNALSAIEDLCDIDIDITKTAINDFAHYLRGNLEAIGNKRLIPFEDELEHVETYLALEKLRFKEKLNVIYNIKARQFFLPPLTVQPIVENAVRHGIHKKPGNGIVTISTEETDTVIYICISDDGVGFDPGEPKDDGRIHVGIANVRERLEAQCGGKLEIESKPEMGTNVVITIPKGVFD